MSGDKFSSIMTLAIGSIQYLMPLIVLMFIYRMKDKLEDPDVKARFGSLFEGLKVKRLIHLMSAFFFVFRRMLLVFTVVFLSNYPSF
jgi:hypothetical protein